MKIEITIASNKSFVSPAELLNIVANELIEMTPQDQINGSWAFPVDSNTTISIRRDDFINGTNPYLQ